MKISSGSELTLRTSATVKFGFVPSNMVWYGMPLVYYTMYGGKCHCRQGNQELQFAGFAPCFAMLMMKIKLPVLCLGGGCDHLLDYCGPALHWSLSGQVVVNDCCSVL